jgi:hypothetical protein
MDALPLSPRTDVMMTVILSRYCQQRADILLTFLSASVTGAKESVDTASPERRKERDTLQKINLRTIKGKLA